MILPSLSAKDKNGSTSSIHLRVDEFVGKTNGEAFQLNKRKKQYRQYSPIQRML